MIPTINLFVVNYNLYINIFKINIFYSYNFIAIFDYTYAIFYFYFRSFLVYFLL